MAEIRVNVDMDKVTLDDLIMLEEGTINMRGMRDFVSRFVVDKDGKSAPAEDAIVQVGALTVTQLKDVIDQVKTSLSGDKDDAVNPTSAGG